MAARMAFVDHSDDLDGTWQLVERLVIPTVDASRSIFADVWGRSIAANEAHPTVVGEPGAGRTRLLLELERLVGEQKFLEVRVDLGC